MAWIDDCFLWQREELSERRNDALFVSEGQIGPSYREMEKGIAAKEGFFAWTIEAKASRCVERSVEYLDIDAIKA